MKKKHHTPPTPRMKTCVVTVNCETIIDYMVDKFGFNMIFASSLGFPRSVNYAFIFNIIDRPWGSKIIYWLFCHSKVEKKVKKMHSHNYHVLNFLKNCPKIHFPKLTIKHYPPPYSYANH